MRDLNPCRGFCSTSFGDEYCKGCGRHYIDVLRWNTYTDNRKRRIIEDMARESWDEYFMREAELIATRSKDAIKVGCVAVGYDKVIIGKGYNGLPRLVEDTDERIVGKDRNHFMVHAEQNLIYNCCRTGNSLNRSIVYVTLTPCSQCVRALINCGVDKIVIHKLNHDKFMEKIEKKKEWSISEVMLAEACVEVGFL